MLLDAIRKAEHAPRLSLRQMVLAFSAVAGFGYAVYATMPERRVAKRSYPFEGLKAELGGLESTPKVSVGFDGGWKAGRTLELISSLLAAFRLSPRHWRTTSRSARQ